MIHHTTDRPILVSVLLILFGLLWLFWLHKLHTTKQPIASTNGATDSKNVPANQLHSELRCHQVTPMLRTTLLVFSIFLALSSVYFICRLVVSEEEIDSAIWIRKMVFAILFLVIFLMQVLYIVHMTRNKRNVSDGCSIYQRLQMYTVGAFAIVQVCVGVYLFMVI